MPRWTPPTIVAEALVGVPDPLITALRPGPAAPARAVAASLAQSMAPGEDPADPPQWLLPQQERSFRRVLAAMRQHGGALLADPVGSGKTYVALAVASALNRGAPTACLVPATLMLQWKSAADSVGIALCLGSHEQASRGALPSGSRGLVIIDESHHFRNPHTRRYEHVAPWLVGRPVLLVTATPVVNTLADLGNQLWLAVRDNALATDGVASLRALLAEGRAAPALGRIIVENEAIAEGRPLRAPKTSVSHAEEWDDAARSIQTVSRLRLSSNESIAQLIRGVLLRAAASSPAAFAGALRRYRTLLLNGRDALRAGLSMDRAQLRRFTAGLEDQLIWWELLPHETTGSDLELDDLEALEDHIKTAESASKDPDRKLGQLAELLRDSKPTLIFTTSRDTVRYIRERLKDFPLAWCTGDRAGIGITTLPRPDVLEWFREGAPLGLDSRHLVVTDVAAEGLDLQRAARVVHYDLPWTPMRLEQREGRAIRLGSLHSQVEVVRFIPPEILERRLRLEAILERKAMLPDSAGLGAGGRRLWRWRAELAELFIGKESSPGVAAVASEQTGLLAGFSFHRPEDPASLSASLGWLEPGGAWIESPDVLESRILAAASSREAPVSGELLQSYLGRLTGPIRARLALVRGGRWLSSSPARSTRHVTGRLNELIRQAARCRQAPRMLRLERALSFLAGGHTAGEAMLIENLAEAGDRQLESVLARQARQGTDLEEVDVRLTGLIVFGSEGSGVGS